MKYIVILSLWATPTLAKEGELHMTIGPSQWMTVPGAKPGQCIASQPDANGNMYWIDCPTSNTAIILKSIPKGCRIEFGTQITFDCTGAKQ